MGRGGKSPGLARFDGAVRRPDADWLDDADWPDASDGQSPAGCSSAPSWRARLLAGLPEQLASEQQRWFLWFPVAFGLGIGLYFLISWEPPLLACLLPLPASMLLAYFNRSGVVQILFTSLLVAVCAGLFVAKLRTEALRAPVLERQLRGATVSGWLELVEPRQGGGQRLTILVRSLGRLPPHRRPVRVRVTTRGADNSLQPGDAIRLQATVGPPGIPAQPHGYDFARYAWFKQLGGVGYTRARPLRDQTAGPPPLWLQAAAAIQGFRQRIGRRIDQVLPGETGAIAKALTTGERGGISDATNDLFRDSGLFHILSISGLHMAIMAGAIFVVIRFGLAMVPSIALRYPIKKWGALAAALGALGYLTISGGTFATVRSYVMISIMFFAILLDRPAVALRNVALAALVILALFPESLLNVGFQMSFAAVVSLVAAYEALSDRRVRKGLSREVGRSRGRWQLFGLFFAGIILTTLIASAAVAPFAAFHFHKSQQYAVLANLIAVPICNILVMPAALATFLAMPFGLEAGPLWLMGKGIDGMIWVAGFVARLPGAVGLLPQIPAAAFLVMVGGGLWLTLWRRRWRLLGLLPIMLGLALAPGFQPYDLLVGGRGDLIAVRVDGRLSALPVRGSTYQLSRWLEADGDERDAKTAMTGEGFRCDAIGCTVRLKGKRVAVPRHVAALRDDCAKADIIVTKLRLPSWCAAQEPRAPVAATGPGAAAETRPPARAIKIDRRALRHHGPHAIRIEGAGIIVDTVAAQRGRRPWSMVPH